MSVILLPVECQSHSNKKMFGLCDDPPPPHKAAYLDEDNGGKWIAVVENDEEHDITFTAIDHCMEMKDKDGKQSKQCDGVLTYSDNIIFVELKESDDRQGHWIKNGVKQLKTTIDYFKNRKFDMDDYKYKRAYLANNEHPKSQESQITRMERFLVETDFTLRIENRIKIQ